MARRVRRLSLDVAGMDGDDVIMEAYCDLIDELVTAIAFDSWENAWEAGYAAGRSEPNPTQPL